MCTPGAGRAVAARRRVGVVVLVDPPQGDWIDGVRRAVGDGAVDRIRPHITLVPPLNLKVADMAAALTRLRAAAAAVPGPLQLTLGPPATFLPSNPVLFLEVGGDVDGLRQLRDAVFAAPLQRPLAWPWVPHVTLADDLAPERIPPLVGALGRFALAATARRLTLLDEHHPLRPEGARRWVPIADAALGPPAVVGRGGLPLTLTAGTVPDPHAEVLLGELPASRGPRIVISGHRDGVLAGAAAAWLADDGGHVRVVVDPASRRSGVGSHLLAATEHAVREAGWACPVLHAEGPAGFYRSRSAWSRPALP